MKNWKMEMNLDPDLTESEKEKFLELIEKTDIPSIEEFAGDLQREDVQEAYWTKYGEQIADLRNQATEEE